MSLYKESVQAFAKINLHLGIGSRRSDGYHDLFTIMQSVSLCDEVMVTCSDETQSPGITIRVQLPNPLPSAQECLNPLTRTDLLDVPLNGHNTAYKAADLFLKVAGLDKLALEIDIIKSIPSQAGLGGGSSDAAAVLRILSSMFPHVNKEEIFSLASKIGADVPFCMVGGTRLCQGIGEIMRPLATLPDFSVLLIKPPIYISTAKAFALFDQTNITQGNPASYPPPIDKFLADSRHTISAEEFLATATYFHNDFQPSAQEQHPLLKEICQFLSSQGAIFTQMSGSGSTVFGLFPTSSQRDHAFEAAGAYSTAGCFIAKTELVAGY